MALLCRNNVNILPLMSNCRTKIKSGLTKQKKSTFINRDVQQNMREQFRGREQSAPYTFADFISNERFKATKSILVQVQNDTSYPELQRLLIHYGDINAAFYYQINSNHYILIEFVDQSSVYKVVDSAMFLDRTVCVPVRSNFLWFRSDDISLNNKQKNDATKPRLIRTSMSSKNIYNTINHIFSNNHTLVAQIQSFQSSMELQELDLRLRFLIAWQIECLFGNLFDACKVYPFGSSVNSYGIHACDLDLVLNLEEVLNFEGMPRSRLMLQTKQMVNFDNAFTKNLLDTLGSIMHHCVPGASHVKKILNARVPIIKYNHGYTGLECDLSVANLTAFYMSELLWLFGKADQRVRPLVYTVRYWAQRNSMTRDSPGPWITNFSLTLLVLFFFQQKKILPTLNELHSNASARDVRFSGNVDCTFTRDLNKFPVNSLSKKLPLDQLLFEFFEYYAAFDFYTQAIDLRSGQPVAKRASAALYIINPLETRLNVSKNVTAEEVDKMKLMCDNAIKIFRGMPDNSPDILPKLFKMRNDNDASVSQKEDKKIEVRNLLNNQLSTTSKKDSVEKMTNVAHVKSK